MGKNPAFFFYPSDWSRDLEEHPLEIEGAWIRICCKLWWSEERGKLSKTIDQWARILRVSIEEAGRILTYIQREKIGDVSPLGFPLGSQLSDTILTVISRRMYRDEKDRINNNLRQKKHYEKHKSNTNDNTKLTTPSSSTSSSKASKDSLKTLKTKTLEPDGSFDIFWNLYPRKTAKENARKSWSKIPQTDRPILMIALEKQIQAGHLNLNEKEFIPHPATWLNQKRWEEEIIPHRNNNGQPKNKTVVCHFCGHTALADLNEFEAECISCDQPYYKRLPDGCHTENWPDASDNHSVENLIQRVANAHSA